MGLLQPAATGVYAKCRSVYVEVQRPAVAARPYKASGNRYENQSLPAVTTAL